MKKELLFVVDEREMGGVSVVLNDLVHLLDSNLFQIDILVLHNKGNMLQQLPKNTRLIYGTPYFSAIDYSLSQVLHKKDLSLIMKKLRVIFDLKTGFIKKRIVKERKKYVQRNTMWKLLLKMVFALCLRLMAILQRKFIGYTVLIRHLILMLIIQRYFKML